MSAQFEPRVRFNWGFHDAQHDCAMSWPDRRECDTVNGLRRPLPSGDQGAAYRLGYDAGQRDYAEHGKRNDSSEAAWQSLSVVVRDSLV